MRYFLLALSLWLNAVLTQCDSKPEGEVDIYEGMDMRTKVRMRQYMVQGKQLYVIHCQNCHGEDGKGLGELIPPLAKADYLMEDINRAICITQNGQQGSIMVNGKEYNQPMPAHYDLKPLEIAEIITYITNAWGNKSGIHEVKEVEGVLAGCERSSY